MTLEEHLDDLELKKKHLEKALKMYGPDPHLQNDYHLTVNNIQISQQVLNDKMKTTTKYAAWTQYWMENNVSYKTIEVTITNANWQNTIDFLQQYEDELAYRFEMYIEHPQSKAVFTIASPDDNLLVLAKLST